MATAAASATADDPVLVVSLDQAHSVTDLAGIEPAAGIRSVAEGLDVLELDTLGLLEDRYAAVAALVAVVGGHDHAERFDLPAPEELTGLPGVQELLALTEVARLADEGRWRTVIVDTPASADAYRMLSAPEVIGGYLQRIWPQHSRIDTATGPDPRAAMIVALFDRILAGIDTVRALLADRDRTGVTLVTSPDRAGLAELRRVRSWIALAGWRLDEVIVNGLVPDLGSDGAAARWLAAERAAQRAVLDEVSATVTDVPVYTCLRRPGDPVGWGPLGELGEALRGESGMRSAPQDVGDPVRIRHESGTGVDAVYTMRMHLPLAEPSSLTLGRAGDDLVVSADGVRRRVPLASGLRRCTVSGAEFDGTDLLVRFVPDPAVWPR